MVAVSPANDALSTSAPFSRDPEPPLARELRRAWAGERHSFHMPGHKSGRGASPLAIELLGAAAYAADLSEVGGFDYLHAPTGAILEAQQRAAALFGAERTWFLVNGSTVGNIAAIRATVREGDKVLVGRNSHRSVYAGLVLTGAIPVYLTPMHNAELDGFFGIDPEAVARALRTHPDIRAVHITSPDYYGFTCRTAAIAEIAHAHGVPLIVDEAHGSHFCFDPAFPQPALAAGADIAVQSPHKTLGSLTQSSLLHRQGPLIDDERVSAVLQQLQSSSPSALLLLSLDLACAAMNGPGRLQWASAVELAGMARLRLQALDGVTVPGHEIVGRGGIEQFDPTKLVLDVHQLGITGFAGAAWLRARHQLNPEFSDLRRMVFSVTIADDAVTTNALVAAIEDLVTSTPRPRPVPAVAPPPSDRTGVAIVPEVVLSPRAADQRDHVAVDLAASVGLIAAEMVIPYPPGIPLLAPGERITAAALTALGHLAAAGCRIVGMADGTGTTIRCIA